MRSDKGTYRKSICLRGHMLSTIDSRDKQGKCNACKIVRFKNRYTPHPRIKKQFCPKDHDTFVVGRDKKGACKQCLNSAIKKYRKQHREIYIASNLKNKTNRNLRIVPWTDWNKINTIVRMCPVNKEVDHYIPLQGKLVSGLHVSWNLCYLTPKENRSKHNKINILEISNWYGKLLEESGLK